MHKDIVTKKGWRQIVVDLGKALGIRCIYGDPQPWLVYGSRIGFWVYDFREAVKKILIIHLKIGLVLLAWIFGKEDKGFRILAIHVCGKEIRALLGFTYSKGFDICHLKGEIVVITIHLLFFRYTYTKILKPYKGEEDEEVL
jgi:hypothetical protein